MSKPESYNFRALFFNPGGDPAEVLGDQVEAQEDYILFNGIPDIEEYIGVTNVTVMNGNFPDASGISQVPTNEIVVT